MNWPFAIALIAVAAGITLLINQRLRVEEEQGVPKIVSEHERALAMLAMTDSLAVH